MPRHAEQRVLIYTAAQLFDLVHAVKRYPEFLPWCLDARITSHEDKAFHADLVIGFGSLRETYGSRVSFERPCRVNVTPTHGPFRRMSNAWRFEDLNGGRCRLSFEVDFKFRSPVLETLMAPLFLVAIRRMVQAFENRAEQLYGIRENSEGSGPKP